MQPFTKNPVCLKCTGGDVTLRFLRAGEFDSHDGRGYRAFPEHLEVICKGCGFRWEMEPADALEKIPRLD